MRDILLCIIVFGALPFVLSRPFVGVMLWSWLSYMNPHRLTYGFAYTMPFAQLTAVTLLISVIFSKEKKSFPVDGVMVAWFALMIWMCITTFFAIHPGGAQVQFEKAMKILLMTFVTIMVTRDQKRIDLLIWVICISIGFYSIKGGIFTILTAGQFKVYGPDGTFIAENNALAVATLMVVPLMAYLRSVSPQKWVRLGLMGAMFFSCVSALGSQSRGALLAMGTLGLYFWLQSKSKFLSGIVVLLMALFAFSFMPASWHERMGTIATYEEDASAMSRLDSWAFSINIANARLTGGGFGAFSRYTYALYYKPVRSAFVAHSIYFDMLAQHGWPGFLMWALIMYLTWRNLNLVIAEKRKKDQDSPALMLARMLKLSMVAFLSGGAFLSLSYHDLPWHIIALAYLLKQQMNPAFNGNKQDVAAASADPSAHTLAGSGAPPGQARHLDSGHRSSLQKNF